MKEKCRNCRKETNIEIFCSLECKNSWFMDFDKEAIISIR